MTKTNFVAILYSVWCCLCVLAANERFLYTLLISHVFVVMLKLQKELTQLETDV